MPEVVRISFNRPTRVKYDAPPRSEATGLASERSSGESEASERRASEPPRERSSGESGASEQRASEQPREPVRAGTSTEQAEERFRSVSCGMRVRGARASEAPFRPTAHGRKGTGARRTQVRRAGRAFVRPGGSSAIYDERGRTSGAVCGAGGGANGATSGACGASEAT